MKKYLLRFSYNGTTYNYVVEREGDYDCKNETDRQWLREAVRAGVEVLKIKVPNKNRVMEAHLYIFIGENSDGINVNMEEYSNIPIDSLDMVNLID